MRKTLQMGLMAVALLVPVTLTINGADRASPAGESAHVSQPGGHSSGWMAKVTLLNGATRTVRIEGVGCSRSICSRTLIKGKAEPESAGRTSLDAIALDAIAAIRGTTPDEALFVLKDGTNRRMSLVSDFRVLYLMDKSGTSKLDLAEVRSVDFASGR